MVIMGPVIYCIILLRVRLCKGDPRLTRVFPLQECIWFIFVAAMKQGTTLKPISGVFLFIFINTYKESSKTAIFVFLRTNTLRKHSFKSLK